MSGKYKFVDLVALGDDILPAVIRHLTQNDIISLSMTCTEIRRICLNDNRRNWETVVVVTDGTFPNFMDVVPFLNKNTRSLEFRKVDDMFNIVCDPCVEGGVFSDLRAITPRLGSFTLENFVMKMWEISIEELPSTLTVLKLRRCRFIKKKRRHDFLQDIHAILPNLTEVDFSFSHWFTFEHWLDLGMLRNLRSLTIMGSSLDIDPDALQYAVEGFPSLEKLDMRFVDLDMYGAIILASFRSSLRHLLLERPHPVISPCQLKLDEFIVHNGFTGLETLVVRHFETITGNINKLYQRNPNLRLIDVTGCDYNIGLAFQLRRLIPGIKVIFRDQLITDKLENQFAKAVRDVESEMTSFTELETEIVQQISRLRFPDSGVTDPLQCSSKDQRKAVVKGASRLLSGEYPKTPHPSPKKQSDAGRGNYLSGSMFSSPKLRNWEQKNAILKDAKQEVELLDVARSGCNLRERADQYVPKNRNWLHGRNERTMMITHPMWRYKVPGNFEICPLLYEFRDLVYPAADFPGDVFMAEETCGLKGEKDRNKKIGLLSMYSCACREPDDITSWF